MVGLENEETVCSHISQICSLAGKQVLHIIRDPAANHPIITHYDRFYSLDNWKSGKIPDNDLDWMKATKTFPTAAIQAAIHDTLSELILLEKDSGLHDPAARRERTWTLATAFFFCLILEDALDTVWDLSGHTFKLWLTNHIIDDSQRWAAAEKCRIACLAAGDVDADGTMSVYKIPAAKDKFKNAHSEWIEPDKLIFVRRVNHQSQVQSPILIMHNGRPIRFARELPPPQHESEEKEVVKGGAVQPQSTQTRPRPKRLVKEKKSVS
uniref:Uncharacterized protein n=1 Tax=Mycena chlorophos TaxID=658473 RepID=A0ABQ0LAY5_MYCCL|nr:predicted protein [Mycena chlorophos]